MEERFYERKVDLPQEGSPRRRMVMVGAFSMSMDRFRLLMVFRFESSSDVGNELGAFGLVDSA